MNERVAVASIMFLVLFLWVHPETYLWADEPAPEESEPEAKSGVNPVKGIASGVAGVGTGAKDLLTDTVEETLAGPPIKGTIEGVQAGSQKLVDSTVKGAYKVATLGLDELESYELETPPKPADATVAQPSKQQDPTKFKVKIPGT
jgi:hypothetical protein